MTARLDASMQQPSLGLRVRWLGCAAYELDLAGVTVVIDPCITINPNHSLTWEDVEKCDMIAVSHSHYDHITDLPKLTEKFHPLVLSGEQTLRPLIRWADYSPMRGYPMTPGLELDFDTVKVKALFGRHTNLGDKMSEYVKYRKDASLNPLDRSDPYVKELSSWGTFEYRNYLFTTRHGVRVLVFGSELTPEQRNIILAERPHVAVMQMTKNDPDETAALCAQAGVRAVLPHHHDFAADHRDLALRLGKALQKIAPDIRYVFPEYGKWYAL